MSLVAMTLSTPPEDVTFAVPATLAAVVALDRLKPSAPSRAPVQGVAWT